MKQQGNIERSDNLPPVEQRGPTFNDRVRQRPLFWYLAYISTGFLAGLAVFKGILMIAQLETVPVGSYTRNSEIEKNFIARTTYDSLEKVYTELKVRLGTPDENREPQPSTQINYPSLTMLELRSIGQVSSEGDSLLSGQLTVEEYQLWCRKAKLLLQNLDERNNTNVRASFDKMTTISESKVHLIVPTLRKAILFLRDIQQRRNHP